MSIETHDSVPRSASGGRHLRRLVTIAPAVLAVITLAACGNSGTSTTAANPAPSAPTATTGAGAGPNGAPRIPGVSGLVAAISGKTLQVQGTSSQTAVTYNGKTTFTATVAGSPADVEVGSCVTVQEPTSTASPTRSTTSTPATKVTAGRVSITAAVKGSCVSAGFGGGGFGNGTRPSGVPIPTPSVSGDAGPDNRAGGFRSFGGTSGKVTAVTGSGFVVESAGFGQAATTTAVTVTTSSTTTFSRTVTATSKAIATGKCVTALGKTDSTGAVTATSISVRAAENGTCTSGPLGARPNGGPNG